MNVSLENGHLRKKSTTWNTIKNNHKLSIFIRVVYLTDRFHVALHLSVIDHR